MTPGLFPRPGEGESGLVASGMGGKPGPPSRWPPSLRRQLSIEPRIPEVGLPLGLSTAKSGGVSEGDSGRVSLPGMVGAPLG